ncbi:MAG: amino acid ABC transporter substrate-binding protein [Methylomicrobium sp.]
MPFDNSAIGEQIYNQGIDSSGEPLEGQTEGDIEFKDAHFNCAQCHRRSGYGSSEGGNYVLPVTGDSLFNPRNFDRADLFKKLFKESQPKLFWARMRSAYQRPAYTDESLVRAIREGIDPSGRKLSPLMPRYKISDRDMAGLTDYIKHLSSHNDPGVNENTIYFATVVSKNANADDKNAMLSTIAKFVEWLNLETKGNLDHPNFSPSYRSDFAKAFRIWNHEVWELSSNPADWPKELAAYYEKKPVFALIGGMADGDWSAIHEFCENNKVPCLFPLTQMPPAEQSGHYSVYFNQGLLLEAKATAKYLLKEKSADPAAAMVVFYSEDAEGSNPAKVFTEMLNADKTRIIDSVPVKDMESFRHEWTKYVESHPKVGTVVVWPGRLKGAILSELTVLFQKTERIFLPSELLQADLTGLPQEMMPKLYFSYPYELPTAYHPHAFRVRAWMNTRKLEVSNARIQFNTYYALNLLQYSLEHVVDHFSRDYLLEYIEHEAENALNPGTFPRLSLGPEQRFASKGAYLVQIDGSESQSIKPVSAWIVP